MRATTLVARLKRLGCIEIRQRGSHKIVRCGDCQTVIPMHRGDLKPGTLRNIVKHLSPCLGEGRFEREEA